MLSKQLFWLGAASMLSLWAVYWTSGTLAAELVASSAIIVIYGLSVASTPNVSAPEDG